MNVVLLTKIAHLLGREGAEGDEHVVSVQQASKMNNRENFTRDEGL